MKKNWNISLPKILAMPLTFMVFFISFSQINAQDCPALLNPLNGSELVPLNSTIRWEQVTGVPGYILSLGTTEGGTDILNEQNLGASNSYTPSTGLPENTEIYVTITLFFFNQPNIVCDSQSFTTAILSEAPECTTFNIPQENAFNINTATNITWNASVSATGYFLTIGRSMNGGEIVDNLDVGNTLSYNPTADLPEETTLYISVIPYNRIGLSVGCISSIFNTAPKADLPFCTAMITPLDGETNVPLSPVLEWNEVPNAIGYRVTIGTSPFESNILEDAIFFKTSTIVIDFEPNRTFFITIIPFNDAGDAVGCAQETFSTLLGCGPYFDPLSGELQVLNPEITFPDTVTICLDNDSNIISATDQTDGYRWFKVDGTGNEILLSSSEEVSISEVGDYVYEVYSVFEDSGRSFECSSSKPFTVEASQAPVIENILVTNQFNTNNYEVLTSESGIYEYALDNENGPYQDSNRFNGITLENHTVYVRDKGGCGSVYQIIEQDVTVEGFPNFFTPNGDGVNDYWQFIPPVVTSENNVLNIWIFDKFGALLAKITPTSVGWNGNFNGRALPESDYWFKAISNNNKIIKGHFSLKR
ncbi:T9SS type B sorting domain-containing protein [uncultured Maribacter sp.]|uniref:T9SS type B sorting domain-containing protein n=1 Tax=uncultured Maribacter sp. TaxID=431308 RepID=UPI0030D7544B|tara:strand:+ start:5728 stop:7497 length:1770 start_codon:yes stop_codon:yes gene_type:complete